MYTVTVTPSHATTETGACLAAPKPGRSAFVFDVTIRNESADGFAPTPQIDFSENLNPQGDGAANKFYWDDDRTEVTPHIGSDAVLAKDVADRCTLKGQVGLSMSDIPPGQSLSYAATITDMPVPVPAGVGLVLNSWIRGRYGDPDYTVITWLIPAAD